MIVLGHDERTSPDVEEERPVRALGRLGDAEPTCIAGHIEHHAAEIAAPARIHRDRRIARSVVGVPRPWTASDGVAVWIGGGGLLAGRVVQLLPKRREQIAPMLPVVRRPVDAALVEPDPAVVLAG